LTSAGRQIPSHLVHDGSKGHSGRCPPATSFRSGIRSGAILCGAPPSIHEGRRTDNRLPRTKAHIRATGFGCSAMDPAMRLGLAGCTGSSCRKRHTVGPSTISNGCAARRRSRSDIREVRRDFAGTAVAGAYRCPTWVQMESGVASELVRCTSHRSLRSQDVGLATSDRAGVDQSMVCNGIVRPATSRSDKCRGSRNGNRGIYWHLDRRLFAPAFEESYTAFAPTSLLRVVAIQRMGVATSRRERSGGRRGRRC
jgi:hypothetical protein